jgi:2-hydroxychromene-2-carboxylate isomerase
MNRSIDFYFDVGSPAAYLAWTQLPALAAAAGGRVNYRPMLLGGVFQATGNQSPMTVPAKGRYMLADLERFAARYRVPFRHNPFFPINTLLLMRMAAGVQLQQPERFTDFVDIVYRAIWVDGCDMNDPGVVAGVLRRGGFDPDALLALAAQPDVKDRLKAMTQEAVSRGVFGAPTFFVDGEMFWGQDRLDFLQQALGTTKP